MQNTIELDDGVFVTCDRVRPFRVPFYPDAHDENVEEEVTDPFFLAEFGQDTALFYIVVVYHGSHSRNCAVLPDPRNLGDLEKISVGRPNGRGPDSSLISPWIYGYLCIHLADLRTIIQCIATLQSSILRMEGGAPSGHKAIGDENSATFFTHRATILPTWSLQPYSSDD